MIQIKNQEHPSQEPKNSFIDPQHKIIADFFGVTIQDQEQLKNFQPYLDRFFQLFFQVGVAPDTPHALLKVLLELSQVAYPDIKRLEKPLPKRGNPEIWHIGKLIHLYSLVHAYLKSRHMKKKDAIKMAARRFNEHEYIAIERAYYKARSLVNQGIISQQFIDDVIANEIQYLSKTL